MKFFILVINVTMLQKCNVANIALYLVHITVCNSNDLVVSNFMHRLVHLHIVLKLYVASCISYPKYDTCSTLYTMIRASKGFLFDRPWRGYLARVRKAYFNSKDATSPAQKLPELSWIRLVCLRSVFVANNLKFVNLMLQCYV